MPDNERETIETARSVDALYRGVFGTDADIAIAFLPGGDPAYVVASWLWCFPSGYQDRWIVRVVIPAGDEWFADRPCLQRLQGQEVEKRDFTQAMVFMAGLESHRRVHAAIDSIGQCR